MYFGGNLKDMPDQDTWQFINSFAPWLAAIGTVAAVITSLYIALRQERIKIKVRATLQILLVQGEGPGHGAEYIGFDVTNLGGRTATVTHLFWRTGIFKKRQYVWIPPENPFSGQIPAKLEDGDRVSFMLEVDTFDSYAKEHMKEALSGWGSLKPRFVRAGVLTSTGGRFESRVGKDLRDHLLKLTKDSAGA